MGYRFFKRIKLAKGLYVNITPSGPSLSIGKTGSRITFGHHGYRTTMGIPGSGLSYTNYERYEKQCNTSNKKNETSPIYDQSQTKIKTTVEEKILIKGCYSLMNGDNVGAYSRLSQVLNFSDASFLIAFMNIQQNRIEDAEIYLKKSLENLDLLGLIVNKFGIIPVVTLPITNEIIAQLVPSQASALLALVEIYQHQEKWQQAIDCLQELIKISPYDLFVRLSYVELLNQVWPDNKEANENVLKLTQDYNNESATHAALLLYRSYALKNLGMLNAAIDLLSSTIRKTKDRPQELMHALRYERAIVFDLLNDKVRARKEFELIYAENPTFEDVSVKLGM